MKKAFTLIELLVVIAIIGLLSAIVLVSLNGARVRARDARRLSDLDQISKAIILYYEQNGYYPDTGGSWRSECPNWGNLAPNDVIPGLVPTYFSSFPTDPGMNKTNNTCCYLYRSNKTDYAFLMHACPETRYLSQPSRIDPARDRPDGGDACIVDGSDIWGWKVYTQGACDW